MDDDNLWRIEEQFWSAGADFYEQHLSEHALMVFPAPAGVLDRAATLDSIQSGSRWVHANFEKRQLLRPTDHVAMLVYSVAASRHEGVAYRALCSSTYVKEGDAWLLALHHQTPQ
ncbi:nuclear transport factor 2 family protein [Variovorax sp. 38R]|uniref:nuclear transport factor 2 family protein n=1 Tax=Variovorax sp. 38R TaxID=2774875 RepID=UPI001781132E|nr:nuclear transport factor 2 family protein [Variovorax sp. 38R]QOF81088.1 nuclear transport factor 2 family protein [Variovorax sp. 38R]